MNKQNKKEVTRQGSTEKTRLTIRFKTEDELKSVESAAADCGFATEKNTGASSYMKSVVLGHNPPNVFDQKVIIEIGKLWGHLGKVGGLFKLAILEGKAGNEMAVYSSEILKTQREIKELMRDIRDGKFNK